MKPSSKLNLMKKRLVFQNSVFLIVSALSVMISVTVPAQPNVNKSPALQRLIVQVEENYMPKQMFNSVGEIELNVPILYVQLLGYAMYNQRKYLNQSNSGKEIFIKLNNEILTIIPQIAETYNRTNYNKSYFEYASAGDLREYYKRAYNGVLSKNFRQNFQKSTGKDISRIYTDNVLVENSGPSYIKGPKRNGEIVILGQSVDMDRRPVDLGNPVLRGLKCPLTSDKDFEIDTNNNPDDKTCITCSYRDDGSIIAQAEYVDGHYHGEYFYFHDFSPDDNIPNVLHEHGMYKNEKKDGVWEVYYYRENAGESKLWERNKYDNGVKVFDERYSYNIETFIEYVDHITNYVDGKASEVTWFYENGGKRMHVSYDPNGGYVKDGCWEEDGTPMACPSYW